MKKIIISSALIVAATVGGFALANTDALSPNAVATTIENSMQKIKGSHSSVHAAIEANDFAAFQIAAKDTPLSVVDTTDEFTQLVAAHAAKKAGDSTQMDALRTQLGLPEKGMRGERGGKGAHGGKKGKMNEALRTSIEANDFAAFQTAAKDTPFAVVDTQDKFTKLVNAEKNVKAAHEAMKAVHTELGIALPEKTKQ